MRTSAYRAAILELVRPGDVVVDLGAGAGVLAIVAARAGARRVFAITEAPLARLGRELAAANDAAHLVEFVVDARGLLAPPARVHVLELDGVPAPGFEAPRCLVTERDGMLHGLAGWFDARFTPDIVLSTAPGAPRTSWGHAFFPAPRPIPVAAGTTIGLIIEAIPSGPVVHWRIRVRLGDGPTQPAYGLDTAQGFTA